MAPLDPYAAAGNVLILGGTSDIGLAIAHRFAKRGTRRVILAGRDLARLEAAGESLDCQTSVAAFDVTAPATHSALIDDLAERHGDLDVAVLAAGVLPDQEAALLDPVAAAEVATVNYSGAVGALVAVANRMRHQGHGVIVVMSSVAAERPRPANFLYGSSKAGLDAFARGLDLALEGSGVRVITVRPGFVKSKMTTGMDPAPLSTTPERVAEAVLSAIARDQRVIRVPGVLGLLMAVIRNLPRSLLLRLPR